MFSGWNGPTWYYGGWPNRGEWDCVFVDVDDDSAVDAAMRLSRGVCVYGVDASAAQRVAQQCVQHGAPASASSTRTLRVGVERPRRRRRARAFTSIAAERRLDDEEEDCRSSCDAMPRGGVCPIGRLAGLAALVDEGEQPKKRIGEAQVGMALL